MRKFTAGTIKHHESSYDRAVLAGMFRDDEDIELAEALLCKQRHENVKVDLRNNALNKVVKLLGEQGACIQAPMTFTEFEAEMRWYNTHFESKMSNHLNDLTRQAIVDYTHRFASSLIANIEKSDDAFKVLKRLVIRLGLHDQVKFF